MHSKHNDICFKTTFDVGKKKLHLHVGIENWQFKSKSSVSI